MAEYKVKMMKAKGVPLDAKALERAPWTAVNPTAPVEEARGDVFSTINAKQRDALGEDYGSGFSSGENYQPPMSPGEIVSDVGQSAAPAAAGVAESTAGVLGDLADSRYTLAHWINRQMSGGVTENQTARDIISGMEKYDPVSYIPNTEDVSGAMDPIYEALGIKDDVRYQPKSPWGQGLYTAGQFVDPYAAGQGAVRGGTKLLKGIK